MDFISLYTLDGVIHLRTDQIRSFEYINERQSLVVDDGTEGMIVISDPKRRNYARMCKHFGTLPMEGGKANGEN